MSLNLLVLTNYFAMEPTNVQGGVGLRFSGLYGSLIKKMLRFTSGQIFWYSHNDRQLRVINNLGTKTTGTSMLNSVLKTLFLSLKYRTPLVVLVAYPYAQPELRKIFEYLLCLLLLRLSSLLNVKIVVDDFDPPVEMYIAFNTVYPQKFSLMYKKVLEFLTINFSNRLLVLSSFWKQYMIDTYHLNEKKIIIIPNGSLIKEIPYVQYVLKKDIKVLYAGSATPAKDIDNLVDVIEQLRKDGLNIHLCIAGAKFMDLPSWVEIVSYKWPIFVTHCLINSDICVIPYPCHKVTFFNAVPAKLFDYMAAGKPIISTNLKYVQSILRTFECGLVAKDWNHFALCLKELVYNPSLAKKLGYNGRVAAEKFYDYNRLSSYLLTEIFKMFAS